MSDSLNIFGTEYNNVAGIISTSTEDVDLTYIRPQGTKSITSNGTTDVTEYATVNVNVSGSATPSLQSKTKSYTPSTSNQSETVTADSGYDGLSSVKINVGAMPTGTAGTPTATKGSVSNHAISITPSVTNTAGYIAGETKTGTAVTVSAAELVSGTKSITENGTGIDVTNYVAVNVAVPSGSPSLQAKTNISPTESSQTITPDSGYDGLSSVQINAISSTYVGSGVTRQAAKTVTPTESSQTAVASGVYTTGAVTVDAISSTYVGSGITQRSSTDLTASGATVTVPAGYYSAQASKSVTTMTLPTSAASSATSGYTSKATISRSTSNQYINIPPGYNSAGGYYTISAVANGSATAPSSISGTSATVSTGTNTITLTKTVSVTPTVSAGYVSSGTAGDSSVSLTASVTTKGATTYTPSTSNQTIASGTYLTGTQTIAGDSNLVGSNIISGKSIFGVAGTVTFVTYYTGTGTPSSSTGSNGDIYLKTVS
jgi:hypothetical protein